MTVETLENTPVSSRVAVDALLGEVGFWKGVVIGDHRFGGQAFYLGRRELGHVHAFERGCFADIPLPRVVRDELVAAGRAASPRPAGLGVDHRADRHAWRSSECGRDPPIEL